MQSFVDQAQPTGTAPDPPPTDLAVAKSHRYVRLAIVALLICLTAAVLHQSVRQGGLLGSVSAYYYTPAQAIFVGALIGLGACMIALKGMTPVEDVFLNLGGVFAILVAIVPTARGADYQAAIEACQESDTPLPNGQDCPTDRALADATEANVANNLFAVLAVGALVLLVALAYAWRDPAVRTRPFWLGLAAAAGLWLAGLVARLALFPWFVDNAHFLAAAGLFLCILVVALANSHRVEGPPGGGTSRAAQSAATVTRLVAASRPGPYTWIARLMLVVAAVSMALMLVGVVSLFWVEILVAGTFAAFWTAQTLVYG